MKTVLVIDDSEFDRTLLQRLLEKRSYRVVCAGSGEEGLALLETEQVDAVLLDSLLPGLSGKEVLGRIRATREAAELPVMMVSGKAESPEIVEALRLGANDYVTKPVDFQVVELRLRGALRIAEMSRELAGLRRERAALEEELALLRGRLQSSSES